MATFQEIVEIINRSTDVSKGLERVLTKDYYGTVEFESSMYPTLVKLIIDAIELKASEQKYKGDDKPSIISIATDTQNKLVVLWDDGTTDTLGEIKGKDGNTITAIGLSNGELIYSDSVNGQTNFGGIVGQNGIGITGISMDAEGNITVVNQNGVSSEVGNVDYSNYVVLESLSVDQDQNLIATFADGSTKIVGNVRGAAGSDGTVVEEIFIQDQKMSFSLSTGSSIEVGGTVPNTTVTATENDVLSVRKNSDNELVFTLMDKSEVNIGSTDGQDNPYIVSSEISEGVLIVSLSDSSDISVGTIPEQTITSSESSVNSISIQNDKLIFDLTLTQDQQTIPLIINAGPVKGTDGISITGVSLTDATLSLSTSDGRKETIKDSDNKSVVNGGLTVDGNVSITMNDGSTVDSVDSVNGVSDIITGTTIDGGSLIVLTSLSEFEVPDVYPQSPTSGVLSGETINFTFKNGTSVSLDIMGANAPKGTELTDAYISSSNILYLLNDDQNATTVGKLDLIQSMQVIGGQLTVTNIRGETRNLGDITTYNGGIPTAGVDSFIPVSGGVDTNGVLTITMNNTETFNAEIGGGMGRYITDLSLDPDRFLIAETQDGLTYRSNISIDGYDSVVVDDLVIESDRTLTVSYNNGTTTSLPVIDGMDTVYITDMTIDQERHLIITLSTSQEIDMGVIDGKDSITIDDVYINNNRKIEVKLSDNTTQEFTNIDGLEFENIKIDSEGYIVSVVNGEKYVSTGKIYRGIDNFTYDRNEYKFDLDHIPTTISNPDGVDGEHPVSIDVSTNSLVFNTNEGNQINAGVLNWNRVVDANIVNDTLTITDKNGDEYVFTEISGEDGINVVSAYIDTDKNLVLTMSDGTSKFVNGVQGDDGKNITDVSLDGTKHLIFTFDDGSTIDAGLIDTDYGFAPFDSEKDYTYGQPVVSNGYAYIVSDVDGNESTIPEQSSHWDVLLTDSMTFDTFPPVPLTSGEQFNNNLSLEASRPKFLYSVDRFDNRTFEVATDINFTDIIFTDTVKSYFSIIDTSLTVGDTYFWRCRDKNMTTGNVGQWSETSSFFISSVMIETPTITFDGISDSSNVDAVVSVQSSPYVPQNTVEPHTTSDWLITNTVSGETVFLESKPNIDLTSFVSDFGVLEESTTYEITVRYRSNSYVSGWAVPIQFTTSDIFSFQIQPLVAYLGENASSTGARPRFRASFIDQDWVKSKLFDDKVKSRWEISKVSDGTVVYDTQATFNELIDITTGIVLDSGVDYRIRVMYESSRFSTSSVWSDYFMFTPNWVHTIDLSSVTDPSSILVGTENTFTATVDTMNEKSVALNWKVMLNDSVILELANSKQSSITILPNQEGELIVSVTSIGIDTQASDSITATVKANNVLPGNNTIIYGDEIRGYYGPVDSSELPTAQEISSITGITQGTLREIAEWYKFSYDGYTIYVPKDPIRAGVAWDTIYKAGAAYSDGYDYPASLNYVTRVRQNASVTIDGNIFQIRLMKGSSINPLPYSSTPISASSSSMLNNEWKDLIVPITNGTWDNVNDMVFSDGFQTWCMEVSTSSYNGLLRGVGSADSPGYLRPASDPQYRGWRPVLVFGES